MNGHYNKQRGRNHQRRRQGGGGGGGNPNRALDSNGPDVRIRGTAQQVYDKYLALARDATSAGDRVKAENYFQHAEHYFRVLRSVQGPQGQPGDQSGDIDDGDQPSFGDRDQRQPSPQFEGDDQDAGGSVDNPPADAALNGSGEERAPEHRGQDRDNDRGQDRHQGGGDIDSRRRRRRRRPRDEGGPAEAGEDATPEPVTG